MAAPNGIEAFRVIFRYISVVTEQPAAERVLEIVLREAPTAEEAMTTLAEKWKAEGRQEAVATLAEKWKAEGRAELRAAVLLQLLTQKFDSLPEATRSRIAAATETELERWTARVLSATSLDSVFGDE